MTDILQTNAPGTLEFIDSVVLRELSGSGADLGLAERSNLVELDCQFHHHWKLGRNFLMAWSAHDRGVLILVVPHYAVADYALNHGADTVDQTRVESESFLMRLLSGSRELDLRHLESAARLMETEPVYIPLRKPLTRRPAETRIIEQLLRRYSISFVPSRAVALFDIVGFSLLSPFEQMTQLNSLSCSLNSAHSRLLARKLDVNFARKGTGDGFYIWNRDPGMDADTNLYHFMHLVLADNAIARRKAHGRTVPLLRACFHVGSCYEFHHAEGLNPTIYSDIVGDVTIELARMIDRAMPGQIFVGDFRTEAGAREQNIVDAIGFIDRAQTNLTDLNGLELSGEAIESIKCYLTGKPTDNGDFTVRKLSIQDKHGLSRYVFNAKINIYRCAADPIFLGIEDRLLRGDTLTMTTAEHINPEPAHH